MNQWLSGAIVCLVFSAQVHAQSPRHFLIQSPVDQFELVLNGNRGSVGGKPADLTSFKDLLPILTDPLANDCTLPKGTADVTVREAGKTRYLYIRKGVVTDGTNCLTVGGQGLYYFPIHRDFLVGPKQESLVIASPVKVSRDGATLFELREKSGVWEPIHAQSLLDWDFMERWLSSLKTYSVRFRVQPEIAKDKPKVTVRAGGDTYTFYKLNDVNWAVKKPGSKWLEASDDWSFWYNLNAAVLTDHLADKILLVEDTSKDKSQRLAALESTKTTWSRNLRDMCHKLLLNPNEDPELTSRALQRLHGHPSQESAGVMVQFLSLAKDEDSKRDAGTILKIINPKGPKYDPSESEEQRAKVVEYWSQWWKKNAHNK
jgi:hypothetical protein